MFSNFVVKSAQINSTVFYSSVCGLLFCGARGFQLNCMINENFLLWDLCLKYDNFNFKGCIIFEKISFKICNINFCLEQKLKLDKNDRF